MNLAFFLKFRVLEGNFSETNWYIELNFSEIAEILIPFLLLPSSDNDKHMLKRQKNVNKDSPIRESSFCSRIKQDRILGLNLPGQSDKLQGIICLSEPAQLLPPNLGDGLSHLRMRSLLPGPHLAEQKLHMFHEPQFPCTAKERGEFQEGHCFS